MNLEELRQAYEARIPALTELGQWVAQTVVAKLEEQLGSTRKAKKFLQIPPEPRVKETASFLEKATIRKPKPNPLMDITDQVGVRFVVLLLDDIRLICGIIENGPWVSQKDRDFHTEKLAKADYFAYQSDHYVISTDRQRTKNGIVIPQGMTCEIQIRTILQHAYAEMAHAYSYKPENDVPDEDQRQINRALAKGSALTETTDDVFTDIHNKIEAYNDATNNLLKLSGDMYSSLTGFTPNSDTAFSKLVVKIYNKQIRTISQDRLKQWIETQTDLGEQLIEKRNNSVLFCDAALIVLLYLVYNYPTSIMRNWPADRECLHELYTFLGVSTEGLF